MTKLDLSALKKQKNAGETTAVVAAIPSAVTAEPAPVVAPEVIAPAVSVAAEPVKTADSPLKPKLSLSSFKKPGSVVATAPVVVPAIAETVSVTEPETVSAEATESSITESEPVVEMPEPVVAVVEAVESTTEEIAAEALAEIESIQAFQETEEPAVPSSSEFFPNLALENDNLFSDIVGMGSFEEEKEEPVVEVIEVIEPVVAEISVPEVEIVPEMEAIAAEVTSEQATSILESIDSPSFEEMMTSGEPIVDSMEAATADTATAAEAIPKTEYVESVAKELSKERKGGLSELFDKKRKVLFGVSALVVASVGVVGSLYGFGVLDGSKANVVESKSVEVAMVKKPDPKPPVETPSEVKSKDGAMAELPPPIVPEPLTASGKTASGVAIVVTPVSAHTGSTVLPPAAASTGATVASASGATVATGSGKTVPATTVAPAASTGATVAPANSNVNTLRTPNVRKKRGE